MIIIIITTYTMIIIITIITTYTMIIIITIITTHLHHNHHYDDDDDDQHHYYHQHHCDHHYYSGLKVIPQCVPLWRLLIKLETAVKGSMKARATGEMCRLKVPYTLTDLCLM